MGEVYRARDTKLVELGEAKNGKGHMFPLTPELRDVLEHQRAKT